MRRPPPDTEPPHRLGRLWHLSALVIAALACLLPLTFMSAKSITCDEVAHLPAGYAFLKTGNSQIDPTHPPLMRAICAVPLLLLNPPLPPLTDELVNVNLPPGFQFVFGRRFFEDQDIER